MIKKVVELSKIFIKDYFQKLDIFNENTKKTNKKSVFFWLLIITVCAISYLSYKIINWLDATGQAVLFLKVYFPILATVFMFQAILICSNVFYFSKDLENILPLPIKPVELLIAKFINVIVITYLMEGIFLVVPLFIYGIIASTSLLYFLSAIIVLIFFPILPIIVISIIMLLIMQVSKFIKNKDIFQILLVIILSIIITFAETYIIKNIFNSNIIEVETSEINEIENAKINLEILNIKLDKINNYFIFINPCIEILTVNKIINILINLFKIIFIDLITFLIFIYFGKILYLKNLLKNISYINKNKKNKINRKIKYKKNKIKKSYIKNEFKKIIKNPTFFIQCIFQYLFIIIIILFLINVLMPNMIQIIQDENMIEEIGKDNFNLQMICIIIGLIQILFTLNNLSITAISRDGKNATNLKTLPISLYKQFVWKNIPQILICTIMILAVISIFYINMSKLLNISIIYFLIIFLIAMILNIINSFLMLIVDLKKPNLNWQTETAAIKDNENKLYQYVTTIIFILLLIYFAKIFKNINIKISLLIITIILFIILFIINLYVKKNINKLFKNIN